MMNFLKKPFRWAIVYGTVLTIFTAYVMLDTFVIPKKIKMEDYSQNLSHENGMESGSGSQSDPAVIRTENSYSDSNISITISQKQQYDTVIYIADVEIKNVEYLKTAFAQSTYGRNIKETTSQMAQNNGAILAINGDYYGFREDGYVLRNGVIYRETVRKDQSYGDLVIYEDGSFDIINEGNSNIETIAEDGAMQIFSFGPALVSAGKISVDTESEVGMAKESNPRTAIGMITPLHYIIVVSDGRTQESAGLSLYELAEVMKAQNCSIAYNLDGGGSSTLWFNGKVINNPTDGSKMGERKVSDIVYVGY